MPRRATRAPPARSPAPPPPPARCRRSGCSRASARRGRRSSAPRSTCRSRIRRRVPASRRARSPATPSTAFSSVRGLRSSTRSTTAPRRRSARDVAHASSGSPVRSVARRARGDGRGLDPPGHPAGQRRLGRSARAPRLGRVGHRGWNAQPAGIPSRRGIVPSIWIRRSRSSRIEGIDPISPTVYGCAGAWMTASTGPISTMRPAYITATRSAVSAITPMSWVTSITAVPWSRHRRFSNWMICAWIDTSSAVVGSSANDEARVRRQRERDHDPLPHAARELVRIVIDPARGGRNADLVEQRDGAALRLGRAHRQVRGDRSRPAAGRP